MTTNTSTPVPVWAIFVTVPGHGTDGQDDQMFPVAHGWQAKDDAESAMSRLNEIAQSAFWWVNDPLQNQIDLAKAVDGASFDLDELEGFIGFPMHVGSL